MYRDSYVMKNQNLPNRMARRTRNGSSRKVAFGGKGVTIFPDLRSEIPAKYQRSY